MSIRLVSSDGAVYWFTTSNWVRVLRFAKSSGWQRVPGLSPREWPDRAGKLDESCEVVGAAHIDEQAAAALADAVDRGLHDPDNRFLETMVRRATEQVTRHYPGFNWTKTAGDVAHEWATFVAFARRGAFRVDCVD